MTYNKELIKLHKPLIVLTGPTAVGKTALSIDFAKAINGEIISADSVQVYKGMDVGSAKITASEMDHVPHHLIDILNPDEEFNVMHFKQYATDAIHSIYERGHIPIITGGTGFYIQSVLYDIQFEEEEESDIRKQLELDAVKYGAEYLYEKLKQVDKPYADSLHANNVKRVIRALEFYELNGYPFSAHNKKQRENTSPYLFRYYVLNEPREILYDRIEKRVDQMVSLGLLEEVTNLKELGYHRDLVSMQGIGYKEIYSHLKKECTLEEAIAAIKLNTRHFAKRQLTWFRREKEVTWIHKQDFSHDSSKILEYLLHDFYEHIGKELQ
ncbi:MAG: tRNA (adenosine(37)-N6)-dimethylallyltransferase MiaA [Lachnospiraceae bacterium]|nr:tRNA (adenosine(37)-N6)-dimethylallyltransferase MiaA [Lachnospiraceae bacterium]